MELSVLTIVLLVLVVDLLELVLLIAVEVESEVLEARWKLWWC